MSLSKLVIIKLAHGGEEIMSLVFCASQTFVSHPDLEINHGIGWGFRTSVTSVKAHKSEVHLNKRHRKVKQLVHYHRAGLQTQVFGELPGPCPGPSGDGDMGIETFFFLKKRFY